MKKAIQATIFKWRQTEPELILGAVRWYLRYSLSFPDVEELLSDAAWRRTTRQSDAGSSATVRARGEAAPSSQANPQVWRVDETYVRVKGTVKLTDFLEVPLIDMPAKSLIFRPS